MRRIKGRSILKLSPATGTAHLRQKSWCPTSSVMSHGNGNLSFEEIQATRNSPTKSPDASCVDSLTKPIEWFGSITVVALVARLEKILPLRCRLRVSLR